MKMVDFKKKLLMKISRLEYKHVFFTDEYIDTELKYKKLKANLNKVENTIKTLINIEHGGRAAKTLKQGLTTISAAVNSKLFDHKDIFLQMAEVYEDFAKSDDDQIQNLGNKMAKAFENISDLKIKFNEACKKEINIISEMKNKIDLIDKERDNAKIYRYDLEKCKQRESGDNREDNDRYEELYNKAVSQSLVMMNDFLGDDGMHGLLKRVYNYNVEFYKNSAQAIESAK